MGKLVTSWPSEVDALVGGAGATKTGGSGNRITLIGKMMININQGPEPQSGTPGSAHVIPNHSCQKDVPCQVTLGLGTGLGLGLNVGPTIAPP